MLPRGMAYLAIGLLLSFGSVAQANGNAEALALSHVVQKTSANLADLLVVENVSATVVEAAFTGNIVTIVNMETTLVSTVVVQDNDKILSLDDILFPLVMARLADGKFMPGVRPVIEASPDVVGTWIVACRFDRSGYPDWRPDMEKLPFDSTAEQIDSVLLSKYQSLVEDATSACAPLQAKLQDELGVSSTLIPFALSVSIETTGRNVLDLSSWAESQFIFDSSVQIKQTYSEHALSSRLDLAHSTFPWLPYLPAPGSVKVIQTEVGNYYDPATMPLPPHQQLVQESSWDDPHGAAVTGVIANTSSNQLVSPAYAPGASILYGSLGSGGFFFSSPYSAMSQTVSQGMQLGARVHNSSWGSDVSTQSQAVVGTGGFILDAAAFNGGLVSVVSAGNDGDEKYAFVSDPATGFNVLAVGAYDTKITREWDGDTMASFSSYIDADMSLGGNRKPDLVAPGQAIPLIWPVTGFESHDGTSFAAPAVTGTTALLFDKVPWLKGAPETVRAILQATAIHNIEGSAASGDRDGAGALVSYDAVRAAIGKQFGLKQIGWYCPANGPIVLDRVQLHQGVRARIAIAYDSNTDQPWSGYVEFASQRLGLKIVRDPDANPHPVEAMSIGWPGTWAVVDFVPTQTAMYSIVADSSYCLASARYVGWAWWEIP